MFTRSNLRAVLEVCQWKSLNHISFSSAQTNSLCQEAQFCLSEQEKVKAEKTSSQKDCGKLTDNLVFECTKSLGCKQKTSPPLALVGFTVPGSCQIIRLQSHWFCSLPSSRRRTQETTCQRKIFPTAFQMAFHQKIHGFSRNSHTQSVQWEPPSTQPDCDFQCGVHLLLSQHTPWQLRL